MKEKIRRDVLAKRELYQNTDLDSKKITETFLYYFGNKKIYMLYYPHKKEVDTISLIQHLLKSEKTVILPKVKGQDLIPIKIKDLDNLHIGYGGIKEPFGESFNPKDIEVIVVPAVAFNTDGYRIGYGKGYYDRFLSKTIGIKVGFAYDFQIVDFQHDLHDVPMDYVITPKNIYKTRKEE